MTKLSPYISRGLISTKTVFNNLINRNINPKNVIKFIQELAWRDYWQIVWKFKNIDQGIKKKQNDVNNFEIPENILNHKTGIEIIDQSIKKLYNDGYIHNHVRMYIASIVCNIAKSHWKLPSKWFYYYLLDGDLASNNLSWQWVCGANSSKKYYANQENINKFCFTKQKNTFLDKSYEELISSNIPKQLAKTKNIELKFSFEHKNDLSINKNLPTLIYNYYNIDPLWRNNINSNKILIIEPSIYEKNPVSDRNIDFLIKLSSNIQNIQIFLGEFDELYSKIKDNYVYFKEHPLNYNYKGLCDSRDWLFSNNNFYPSFFKFWNASKKELGL